MPDALGGNYVDAIDDARQVAASPGRAVKVRRWRVNNNLPGTRHFCPTVVRTDAVVQATALDVPRLFAELTAEFGADLMLRAAVAAFGFVYIHPLADGNGRVHRFLINDLLRRDGAIPEPVILPVSAAITEDAAERRAYDQVLDAVSGPLMAHVRDRVAFNPATATYPDGVTSNLEFTGDDLAQPVWRYPDLGPHVVFVSHILARTLRDQMRAESRYLRWHARARAALKEIVEMPDQQADRVLRSIEQNRGELSHAMAKEIPLLRDPEVRAAVVAAVSRLQPDDTPIPQRERLP